MIATFLRIKLVVYVAGFHLLSGFSENRGLNRCTILQGVFFNWPSPFSVPKRKTAFSQWDCCTMKFFIKESLLGSLAYFLFGTEQGGAS